MILVTNLNFLHCVFLLKIGLEMIFGDVLERKEAVLHDKKKNVLYSRKIRYFPKGLTHDFGQKFELSLSFVFIENRTSNDVWDVLLKKEALLDYKK